MVSLLSDVCHKIHNFAFHFIHEQLFLETLNHRVTILRKYLYIYSISQSDDRLQSLIYHIFSRSCNIVDKLWISTSHDSKRVE